MDLPAKLQGLLQFQKIKALKVNKLALPNWQKVFNTIAGNARLLMLITSLDPGTFYPRHVGKKVSNGISNHAWGTAIDINAFDHQLGSYIDAARDKDDPNLILYENVFKPAGFDWGNTYRDPMHFEIIRI